MGRRGGRGRVVGLAIRQPRRPRPRLARKLHSRGEVPTRYADVRASGRPRIAQGLPDRWGPSEKQEVPAAGEGTGADAHRNPVHRKPEPPTPELHESGEVRCWYSNRPAAEIEAQSLVDGAADAASAGYIARSWPGQGVRHEYVNACTGYLGRHLPRPRAQRIMDAAIYAAGVTGADEESERRYPSVRTTLDKLERGEPVTGAPRLQTISPGVAEQLQRWHGWSTKQASQEGEASKANGRVN